MIYLFPTVEVVGTSDNSTGCLCLVHACGQAWYKLDPKILECISLAHSKMVQMLSS